MTSIIDAFQPIISMLSVFHHVWFIVYIRMGVYAAFRLEGFIFAIILSVLLVILGSFATGITTFIFAIVLGLVMGNIVKFMAQKILEFY